jgi:hypothetical protein
MQYSLPYSAKFKQGMFFTEGLLGVTKRPLPPFEKEFFASCTCGYSKDTL